MIFGLMGELALDTLKLADASLDYTYWQARAAGFSEGDLRAAIAMGGLGFLCMAVYPESRSPTLAAMVLAFPPSDYDWRRAVRMTLYGLLAVGCIVLMLTAPSTLSQDGGMTVKEVLGDHEARIRLLEKLPSDVELLKGIVFELVNWVKLGFGLVAGAILTWAVNGFLNARGKRRAKED